MRSRGTDRVPVAERSSLGTLRELGSGGEGRVFEVLGSPGVTYKEYLYPDDSSRHETGLTRLIDIGGSIDKSLQASGLGSITSLASWPTTVVRDHGEFVGYLMAKIPDHFMVSIQVGTNPIGTRRPLEWNDLTYRSMSKPNVRMTASYPDNILVRAHLARDFAFVVDALHTAGIILGDISGKNLLWSIANGPAIYLIDTDGFRIRFSGGVSSAKQSPGWIDPTINGRETTVESDRFKLGLAVYRGVFAARDDMPNQEWRTVVGAIAPQLVPPVDRLVSGERPTAHEWATALDAFIRGEDVRTRPTLDLTTTTVPRVASPTPDKRSRPTIQLRPPSR